MQYLVITYDGEEPEREDIQKRLSSSSSGSVVKNSPAMQELHGMQFRFLGREDPLEEGHGNPVSSIPAWKIPWTEESGGLQSIALQRVGHN